MEENNKRKCKKCGTTENVNFEGMCKKCYEESIRIGNDEEQYINSSNSSNNVAQKFLLVVNIIKFLGYFVSIFCGIMLIINVNFWLGLGVCLVIAIITWLSTLLFEAIAEALNLLQDIKNNIKN